MSKISVIILFRLCISLFWTRYLKKKRKLKQCEQYINSLLSVNIKDDHMSFLHTKLIVFHSTLMVVGAGRGPLVTASINAARKADRKIKVFAVEKNPNAIVT